MFKSAAERARRELLSVQRVFLSGEATAVSGVTMGAYLFRNTDPSAGSPAEGSASQG